MATPNYGFEKRQKELAKKRIKEYKIKAKAVRKSGILSEEGSDLDPHTESPEGAGPAAEGAPTPI